MMTEIERQAAFNAARILDARSRVYFARRRLRAAAVMPDPVWYARIAELQAADTYLRGLLEAPEKRLHERIFGRLLKEVERLRRSDARYKREARRG